jgi:alanine racemase
MTMQRGIIAEINLEAVAHNLALVKRLTRQKPVIAVVKADAYGHGAAAISKRLLSDGVHALAVAFAGEGKELRESGVTGQIIALFDHDMEDVLSWDLTPVVSDRATALALSRAADKRSRPVKIHVKIDTGMGRLGFLHDPVQAILDIASFRGIEIEGLMSHFSEADLADVSYAQHQIERFRTVRRDVQKAGLRIPLAHLANSAAVLALPESHFDAVRPGLMLYGCSPLVRTADCGFRNDVGRTEERSSDMIPAMTLKARLLAVRKVPAGTPISYGRTFVTARPSLIGVVSAGYADGFCRRFSNNAPVLVRGEKAPVVGRVCMDLIMVDVTDIADVAEGDEVVLIGRQGNACITASELAERAGTIPYEILTALGHRARKLYAHVA